MQNACGENKLSLEGRKLTNTHIFQWIFLCIKHISLDYRHNLIRVRESWSLYIHIYILGSCFLRVFFLTHRWDLNRRHYSSSEWTWQKRGYFRLPRSSELEPHHCMQINVITRPLPLFESYPPAVNIISIY